MGALEIKEVNLFGDIVTAAKDDTGEIWVGIRWLCQGLGMSEGQWKKQIHNIQKDRVLQGGSNQIPLPTNSGTQPVLCVKLDYVPLWLAKISMTDKTWDENPELGAKLLEYQLKAKDVLAQAFMPQAFNAPMTLDEKINTALEAAKDTRKRLSVVEESVDSMKSDFEIFKDEMPLFPVDTDRITKAAKKKGVEVMGGKDSMAYNDRGLCNAIYRDIYGEIHRQFGVGSYREIPRKDTDRAIAVIERYTPPIVLAERIEKKNAA